jgi:hypothetical protein
MDNEFFTKIPYHLAKYVGPLGPCILEDGVVLAWGHELLCEISDQEFDELREYGTWHHEMPDWILIQRTVLIEEIIKKHGEISDIGLGPSGGFKYITFTKKKRDKKLKHRLLTHVAKEIAQENPRLVTECNKEGLPIPRVPRVSSGRPSGLGRPKPKRGLR